MFDISYKINELVPHSDVCEYLKCGCMGGE